MGWSGSKFVFIWDSQTLPLLLSLSLSYRNEEEVRNKFEAEKIRIKSDKELAAAKKIAKEQEERIAIELRKKEKEEFNNAKRLMLI